MRGQRVTPYEQEAAVSVAHKRSSKTYRRLHATLGRLILWFFRVHVTGGGAPLREPAIYVSNHVAVIDSYVIMAKLPKVYSVKIPAKAEYFADGGVKQRLLRWLVGVAGVPVDRDDKSKSSGQAALAALEAEARSGGSLVLHPEGTRTDGKAVYKAKPGFVYLAWSTGLPVVPIVLRGTATANEPGSARIRRYPVAVEYLPARYLHPPKSLRVMESISAEHPKLHVVDGVSKLRRRSAETQAQHIMEEIARAHEVRYVHEDYRERTKRLDAR